MKKDVIVVYTTNEGNNRRCKKNSETYKTLHTCPYKEDINGDDVSLCNCTESQTHDCAWDI